MNHDLKSKLPLRKKRQFIDIVDDKSHIIIQNVLNSIYNRLDVPDEHFTSHKIEAIKRDIQQLIAISQPHVKKIVNFFED